MSSGAWQFLGVIATGLVMLGVAVGGWVSVRGGRKASPYEALVTRVTRLEERLETVEAENEDLKRGRSQDRTKIADLEAGRADDATKIAGLERRMAGVISDRDDILRWVDVLRIWFASGAKPPPPPIPQHLADVLPAWIPADGAELPKRKEEEQ